MYEEYWKLTCHPFHNTPDPKFFYRSRQHNEALMKLTYAVNENMGAAMLTGAYGCGKTLLSQVLLQQLGASMAAVTSIAHPDMTPLDLLRSIARGIVGDARIPSQRSELMPDAMLEFIEKALVENRRDGKRTLIFIDEAHMMDNRSVLEMTRLLLNFQNSNEFMLTLLLLGHPELAARVADLKQLAQRIPIGCSLEHFDEQDTVGYVIARLGVAGSTEKVFTDDALGQIYQYSGGIPRRINTLCDLSLTVGCAQKTNRIDGNLVTEASKKFGVL